MPCAGEEGRGEWERRRWIFDFPIEITDPRHGGPTEIRLLGPSNDRLFYPADLRWLLRARKDGRDGGDRSERQKRLALEAGGSKGRWRWWW
jgi:hypothetical protein